MAPENQSIPKGFKNLHRQATFRSGKEVVYTAYWESADPFFLGRFRVSIARDFYAEQCRASLSALDTDSLTWGQPLVTIPFPRMKAMAINLHTPPAEDAFSPEFLQDEAQLLALAAKLIKRF